MSGGDTQELTGHYKINLADPLAIANERCVACRRTPSEVNNASSRVTAGVVVFSSWL
jgi:hypothetical protein